MFLELFATFAMGFGAAGVFLLVNKILGGRLPRWLMPALAGAAMIGFTMWSEASWFNRTSGTLPDGLEVAWAHEGAKFYKPWTYIFPQVDRFVAVDTDSVRTNDALPDQRMVDLYFFGRWAPARQVLVVMDCANARRADLLEGVGMDASGVVEDSAWVGLDPNDPVLRVTCKEEIG